MIESLYIDNYKCFVDFEWKIDQLQLVVGDNGTGKSTALKVIDGLRRLICDGDAAAACFDFAPNAWSNRQGSAFGLSVSTDAGVYRYRIDLKRADYFLEVTQESLSLNERELLRSTTPYAQLFVGSDGETRFPSNAKGSAIATIPGEYPGAETLIDFRNALFRTLVLSPAPRSIEGFSEETTFRPDTDLRGLASWLRHIENAVPDAWTRMQSDLHEVLPSFETLKLREVSGDWWGLEVIFAAPQNSERNSYSLWFDDLSDGQKNLIALFAVLHVAMANGDSVFIDEPTNYVSIREIQPWLTAMSDRVHETGAQCVLVSHHPEIVDYLAADYGVVFYRDENDAVRVKRVALDADETLTPAQLMARGWGP